MRTLTTTLISAALLSAAAAVSVASAGSGASPSAVDSRPPVVVELFTSQSCYSCPPAEAFLGELALEDGIIALEYHVDYWNDLVYGFAGKWRDPFSTPANSRRQQAYNARILGSPRAYTPQAIVGGRLDVVGSRRDAVRRAIRQAFQAAEPDLGVRLHPLPGGGFGIDIVGRTARPIPVWLVRFVRKRTTEIRAGENKGKTLVNSHVVTGIRRIGDWHGGSATITIPDPGLAPGEGCAVLVQAEGPGSILGAASCPRPRT